MQCKEYRKLRMRFSKFIATASIAMSCSISCNAAYSAGATSFAYVTTEMGSCMADPTTRLPPDPTTITRIIRVFIPPKLNALHVVRDVEYADPVQRSSPNSDPEMDELSADPPMGDALDSGDQADSYHINPFHIDLLRLPGKSSPDNYIMVRLIIQDNDHYSFYEETDKVISGKTTEFGIHGVGYSGPTRLVKMCYGHVIKPVLGGSQKEIAVFYIKMNPPSSKVIEGGFAFGLISAPYAQTPLIIDPKVKEPG